MDYKETIKKEFEKAMEELTDKVLNVIEELDEINRGYASWDVWDKTKVIDQAVNTLKTEYMEELEKKYL
jgi:Cu/Ag efflux pump CusA